MTEEEKDMKELIKQLTRIADVLEKGNLYVGTKVHNSGSGPGSKTGGWSSLG